MKRFKLPVVMISIASAVLTGCQSTKTESVKSGDTGLLVESDPAMLQLVSIAQNIHARTAINDAILTKRYGIEEEQRIPIDNLPTDIKRLISFPGGVQLPLERAIKQLCVEGGVSYIAPQGRKPISGIYVIFDSQLRTVAEFIADAGRQAGFRADVVLDVTAEPSPTLQIIYKDAVL